MGGLHVFVLRGTGRLERLARVSGGLGGEVIVERVSCCSLVVGGLCTCSLGGLFSRALRTSGVIMYNQWRCVDALAAVKSGLEKSGGVSKGDKRDLKNQCAIGCSLNIFGQSWGKTGRSLEAGWDSAINGSKVHVPSRSVPTLKLARDRESGGKSGRGVVGVLCRTWKDQLSPGR